VVFLLAKERKFPRKILIKKALSGRLPDKHPKKAIIDIEITQDYAGFRGEQNMDYHLRSLSEKDFHIYNGLYLDDGNAFQIDSFLICPSYSLILDSKNIDGKSTIESQFNQVIQESTGTGTSRRIKNPIAQIKRQSFLLMEWLQKRGFYSLPIEAFIVNTNPVGILKTEDPLLAAKVLNAEMLPMRIEAFMNKYTKQILSVSDMKKVKKLLLEADSEEPFDYRRKYVISTKDILKGVHCPKCGHLGMERKNRYWLCPHCGEKSTTAHEKAIHNYFLLIKPTITVSECCEFLNLRSPELQKEFYSQ
jgi:ribosomal protein L37AE/L43A